MAEHRARILAVDAGGTMTDTFIVDELGRFVVGKAQSSPEDESIALIRSAEDALRQWRTTPGESFLHMVAGIYAEQQLARWARPRDTRTAFGMTMNALQGGGTDHLGKPCSILNFEISTVGGGASAVKDGLDYAAAMWNPEGDMADVEIWEILEPLLYLGRRIKPNTAGPGKYRGGSGFESLRMVWKTDGLVLQNAGDGQIICN